MSKKLNEREMLHDALDHIAEAQCFLYETKNPLYHSFAFVVDSALKLGTVIYNDQERILDASSNWEGYEQELFERKKKLKVVK